MATSIEAVANRSTVELNDHNLSLD